MRLKECELNNTLRKLKNKDVIIEIIEDFKTRIEFYNIYIYFNSTTGMIYIKDYTKRNLMTINITTVCYIDFENGNLKIQLDNSVIKIKNKSRRRM